MASGTTSQLALRINSSKDTPIARCDVLVENVDLAGVHFETPLKATVVAYNAVRNKAFYVMHELRASEYTMEVPALHPGSSPDDICEDGLKKLASVITFGAEQEAHLMSDPDGEFGLCAVLNLKKQPEPNKASLSLSFVSPCQVGVFPMHDPACIMELLTKRRVVAAPAAGAKRARSC